MDSYDVIMFIFSILFVAIQVLLINYLLRLEQIGCQCAMDWRRYYIIFYMVVVLLHVVFTTFAERSSLPLLQTLVAILGIINVIVTLQYIARLQREKCECSESVYRDVILLVAIFNAIVYISLIIMVLYLLFSLMGKSLISSTPKKTVSIRPLFKKQK